MQSDDRWSGNDTGHFDQWEYQLQEPEPLPVYWNGFDTWLRRMLFGGLVALVWAIFFALVVIAIKGDL